MRTFRTIRLRLRSLLYGHDVEQELGAELRDHLERQIELHRASGLSPADARAAALREFGNVALIQEQVRDTRRVGWIEDLVRDLGYAARAMRRAPGHTVVAALSLAFAIGANTTMFSLVNVLMLRELPVADPQDLVEIGRETSSGPGNFSYALYERVRDQHTSFSQVFTVSSPTIRGEDDSSERPPMGRYVSGNFFDALGVRPELGRLLAPGDDRLDTMGSTVAVIGFGLWQRTFGGDPAVIGKTLTIGGFPPGAAPVPFTIVGVLPRTFHGLTVGLTDDFYLPIATEARVSRNSLLRNQSAGWLKVVGRLKGDTSITAARADVAVIYARYVADAVAFTGEAQMRGLRAGRLTTESVRAGLSGPRHEFARPVLLLMGAVALVLLVACANVVNLLLARALARRGEIGVRLAIGASRGRLVRQLLAESAVLGVLGGSLGLAFAIWATPRIATLMANQDPMVAYDVAPDGTVLLFTAVVSLGSALVAGLVPALRVSRVKVPSLRDDMGARGAGAAMTLWSRGLIAGQVALSLLLLAGALLLVTTLRNFRTGDFGFDREGVLTMRLEPGRAGYSGDRRLAYFREVLERARDTPGVRDAALSLGMPVISSGVDTSFGLEGQPRNPDAQVYVNDITDGYFATTGTRLLLGRDFGSQDGPGSTPVAIVNDAVARRYFGDRNPIGQRVNVSIRGGVEIVGVVATTKYESLRDTDSPIVYTHAFQSANMGGLNLTVKTETDSVALGPSIRRAIQNVAPVPVSPPSTLSARIERTLIKERLIARVLGAFAILALLLASAGLYGVLAYTVTRRTGEIGVRIALGATRGRVLWPVLVESSKLVALGVAIGVSAALALTRLLSTLLYGVTPTDPRVLGGAMLSLFLVALAAGAIPAWRASRVNPLVALRYE
jgi:predicted permease